MPAGTIALTNNSTSVTGNGTSFNNELKANDFIFAIVGGTPYTLGIASVNSDTSITLTVAYKGPSTSGAAWNAIPNQTLVGLTAAIATQTAYAIRGLNYDKDNWQGIYSDAASVTVTRPDMSTFTGPSWGYLSSQYSKALTKSDNLGSVADKEVARNNLGLGTGNTPAFANAELSGRLYLNSDRSTSLRYVAAGSARYLITEGAIMYCPFGYRTAAGSSGAAGTNSYNFNWSGGTLEAWIDSSKVGTVTLSSTSDRELKKDIKYVSENFEGGEREAAAAALEEVLKWKPASFKMKARGIIPESEDQLGFIANDLVTVSPECVSGSGLEEGYDLVAHPNPDGAYYLNHVPLIAKLSLALQGQQQQIEELKYQLRNLGKAS